MVLILALSQILPAVKQAGFKIIIGVWPANGVHLLIEVKVNNYYRQQTNNLLLNLSP